MSWVKSNTEVEEDAARRAAAMAKQQDSSKASAAARAAAAAASANVAQRAKTVDLEARRLQAAAVRAVEEEAAALAAAAELAAAPVDDVGEVEAEESAEPTGYFDEYGDWRDGVRPEFPSDEVYEEEYDAEERIEEAAVGDEEAAPAGRARYEGGEAPAPVVEEDLGEQYLTLAPGIKADFEIPYADLKLPESTLTMEDIDVTIREAYLSDEEFFALFKKDRETWAEQPKWRRDNQKKDKGLF